MIIEFPEHYAANVAVVLVTHGAEVIKAKEYVPAYLEQFRDLWDKGMNYNDTVSSSYWEAVSYHGQDIREVLKRGGFL